MLHLDLEDGGGHARRRRPADLAGGRDPVLARAVAVFGGTLDPATAGLLFPVIWK